MPTQTTLPARPHQDAQPASDLNPMGLVEAEPGVTTESVPVVTTEPGPLEVAQTSRTSRRRSLARWLLLAVVIMGGVGAYFWTHLSSKPLPAGIVSSNGRLEATEIDISAKLAGRI